jgi:diguanylate cyclase (GGDEF)-like protein/PAS domain S-box-containing protein
MGGEALQVGFAGARRWLTSARLRLGRNVPGRSQAIEHALAEAKDKAVAAERAAQTAHDRLRDALDVLPEGIVFLDPDGRYVLWNERYAEIYRKSADHFRPGARFAETLRIGVMRGDYPAAVGREEEWIAERLGKLASPGARHEQQLADGRWIMIEERRTREGGTIGIRVDVTEMKRREASFRTLFEDNPVPMLVYDRETQRILAVNAAGLDLYLYSLPTMLGMRLADLCCSERADAQSGGLRSTGYNPPEEAARHRKADGASIDVAIFSRSLVYDGQAAVIASVIDITERRRAETRIAHMARHDALTDLPNRVLYRERLDEALLSSTGAGLAVLFVDLDQFKSVNDTLGHPAGDALLRQVAERIRNAVTEGATVARLGGDEFAILIEGKTTPHEIDAFARHVIAVISEPYDLEGHRFVIGATIGIAIAPADGADPDKLLKNADLALYRAKADGRGTCRFFEAEMDARVQARRALELDLRCALSEGGIEVHYQPLVNVASGKVAGFEALVRWRHPEHGIVSPATFVPIAEETGLIGQLGEFVLRQSCMDARDWPDEIKIAVNLSPIQFKSCNLLALVTSAIETAGIRASRLEIEITESLLVEKNESTLAALNGLRALGVGISMDDFGTGYSSLSYLRSFPFTKIKIDQSFVSRLSENRDSQAIVRAIIGLGTSLGMTVTAEGVEQAQDLAYLRKHGCTEAQGFLFSHARPAAEAAKLVAPDSAHAAA